MCEHKDEMIPDIRTMLGGMLAEMNWRAVVVGGGERRGREADPPIHRWLHTITSLHQKLVLVHSQIYLGRSLQSKGCFTSFYLWKHTGFTLESKLESTMDG